MERGRSPVRGPHRVRRSAAARAPEAAIRPTSRPSACSPKWRARLGRYGDAEEAARAVPGARARVSRPRAHNFALVCCTGRRSRRALAEIDASLAADPRQSRLSQPARPRCSAASANTGAGDRDLRGGACGVSAPAEGLDELRPRAQDRRPARATASRAYRASPSSSRRSSARRTGVSPTSRRVRFATGDIDGMRAQLARTDLTSRRPLPPSFRARQGAGRRSGEYADSFEHYERGNAPPPHGHCTTTADELTSTCDAAKALLHPGILRRARRRWAAPRPIRSSSSACRARARR